MIQRSCKGGGVEERGHQDIPGVIEGMGDKRLVIGNQIQYRRCKQKETDGRDCYLLLVAIAARWMQHEHAVHD